MKVIKLLCNLFIIVFFLSNTVFADDQPTSDTYFYPGRTQPANDGGAPCVFTKVTGATVREVAENYVAMHNGVTTMECWQRCSNPVRLSAAHEGTGIFRIWSFCFGVGYNLKVEKECYDCKAQNFGPSCEII